MFDFLQPFQNLFSWIKPAIDAAGAISAIAGGIQQNRTAKKAAAEQRAGAAQQDAAAQEQLRAAEYQDQAARIQEEGAAMQRKVADQQRVAAAEKLQIDQANVAREEAETAEKIRRESAAFKEEEAIGRARAAASGFVYNAGRDDDGSSIAMALSSQKKENELQLAFEKAAGISRADIGRRSGQITYDANLAQADQMEAGARATSAQAVGTKAQAAGTRAAAAGTSASAAGSRAQADLTRASGKVALISAIPQALTSAGRVYDWWKRPGDSAPPKVTSSPARGSVGSFWNATENLV